MAVTVVALAGHVTQCAFQTAPIGNVAMTGVVAVAVVVPRWRRNAIRASVPSPVRPVVSAGNVAATVAAALAATVLTRPLFAPMGCVPLSAFLTAQARAVAMTGARGAAASVLKARIAWAAIVRLPVSFTGPVPTTVTASAGSVSTSWMARCVRRCVATARQVGVAFRYR